MNEKNNGGGDEQQSSGTKETGREHAVNPFEQTGATDKEAMDEEAAAEQQRKEALTERD